MTVKKLIEAYFQLPDDWLCGLALVGLPFGHGIKIFRSS